MSKKQRLAEYSFRPALVVTMRETFQKACKAPQVADARRILELAKGRRDEPRPSMHWRLAQIIALTSSLADGLMPVYPTPSRNRRQRSGVTAHFGRFWG
jgi:hypothetical protein